MSGGKGGSTTSETKIPAWLEDAAKKNMARADKVGQIGYAPYYGPEVAAFNDTQKAAFQNNNNAASAFGMATADPMAGMPQAQTFAGGVQGYSSQPMYQETLDTFAAARPGQFAAMNAPFIDPVTGAEPAAPFGNGVAPGGAAVAPPPVAPPPVAPPVTRGSGSGVGSMDWAEAASRASANKNNSSAQNDRDRQNMGETSGGYTSIADMSNGGGAGAKGNTFQGGLLSGTLNKAGVKPKKSSGSDRASGMGGGK